MSERLCPRCMGMGDEPKKVHQETTDENGPLERFTVLTFSLADEAPRCKRCKGKGRVSA